MLFLRFNEHLHAHMDELAYRRDLAVVLVDALLQSCHFLLFSHADRLRRYCSSGASVCPCQRRTASEISQSTPTRNTIAISQRNAVTITGRLSSGHWNGNCLSTFPRSIIQCHAVWATSAERMMVPMRSATANRKNASSAGISNTSTRSWPISTPTLNDSSDVNI